MTDQLTREYEQFKSLTPELRRRLTLHKIKCSDCSVPIVTVVDLSEPAFVYVAFDVRDVSRGSRGYTGDRWVTPWSPWRGGPDVSDPARGWRTFPIHPVCKCQRWPLPWTWLVERIEHSGKRTTVISPREWTIRGHMS